MPIEEKSEIEETQFRGDLNFKMILHSQIEKIANYGSSGDIMGFQNSIQMLDSLLIPYRDAENEKELKKLKNEIKTLEYNFMNKEGKKYRFEGIKYTKIITSKVNPAYVRYLEILMKLMASKNLLLEETAEEKIK